MGVTTCWIGRQGEFSITKDAISLWRPDGPVNNPTVLRARAWVGLCCILLTSALSMPQVARSPTFPYASNGLQVVQEHKASSLQAVCIFAFPSSRFFVPMPIRTHQTGELHSRVHKAGV
jgi:hypothetical protein